jgi:hypothetical protein
VPAGAFDHAGGDRPAAGQRGRVVQVGLLVEQVGGGGGGGLALGRVQVVAGGLAADRCGHDAGAAGQDRPGVVVDPGLGSGADRLKRDAQRLQCPNGDALTLADQAEQQVLGAEVVVVAQPGFVLGKHNDPSRSLLSNPLSGSRLPA